MRKILPLLAVCLSAAFSASSQCTTANINWDALEYLPKGGYTFATASAIANNQYFAIGKNRLNIKYTGTTISSTGEDIVHKGETNAYGKGADIAYTGLGTVTLEFDSEVNNVAFTIFDVDNKESVDLTAVNASLVAQQITVTALASPSDLTITGSPGTAPNIKDVKYSANGQGTGGQNTANTSSFNVDIAGPVKKITIVFNSLGGDQDFWLSDISACVAGAFTTNYYAISKPSNGVPGYVLVAANKGVYAVNTGTGYAKLIFEDGASSGTINSVAYDPYNRIIYYTWSLTNNGSANASERTLRKYDMNTGFVSKVLDDVNSVGLPTFSQGIESGAAAFYDGSLYLGVEGGADNGNGGPKSSSSGRESIIWRIDFNSSGAVSGIAQVYAVSGDTHDWSDFSINNGILYDFNGDASTPDYHHYNLQTGDNQLVTPIKGPKQSAVGWDGTIYWVNSTVAPYANGNVGTEIAIWSNPAIPGWGTSSAPSFGDAGEAFKPQADFGDAPASYDPTVPAVHETVTGLHIGSSVDLEWDKPTTLSGAATEDGNDEDGLDFVRIFINGSNYQTDVKVTNRTGANATLCAWVDYNNDGIFQSTEGITKPVPTGSSEQTIQLMWSAPATTLPDNSYTYMRIRLTSAVNNMTTANPTGHFPDGEVEDYRVLVSSTTLAVKLSDFSARKTAEEKVSLTWNVTDEEAGTKYEIEKGSDGQVWSVIHSRSAQAKSAKAAYHSVDVSPYSGDNYYRLKIVKTDGSVVYSTIKKVVFEKPVTIQVTPNPASSSARLSVQSAQRASAHIRIVDMNGRVLYERNVVVEEGMNGYTLPVQQLPAGMYQAEVWIDSKRYNQQLMIRK